MSETIHASAITEHTIFAEKITILNISIGIHLFYHTLCKNNVEKIIKRRTQE